MKRRNTLFLAVAPLVLLVAGCGGGGDDSLDDRLDLADPKVRLIHAVPGAPPVSLFRNDVAQAADVTALAYKGASRYFDVGTNIDRWDVRTATTPALPVGTSTFDAGRGTKYTLVAVANSATQTEVVTIADPYNKTLGSNNARIRVFNAAYNAAPVDVYLTARGTSVTTVAPTLFNIGFKQAQPGTFNDSIEVEGGSYQLSLAVAGTKNVVFSTPLDIARNADLLFTAVPGSLTPNDVKLLLVRSDEGAPATELSNRP